MACECRARVQASSSGVLSTVFTLYELQSGDATDGMGTRRQVYASHVRARVCDASAHTPAPPDFHGADLSVLSRAVHVLEARHQAVVYKAATLDEDGVKFL